MLVADSNLLIYAANTSSPFHTRCRQLFEQWRQQPEPWHLTWGIIYEFLRVSTHSRVFEKPLTSSDAWTLVDSLLSSPGLVLLTEGPRHTDIVAGMLREIPELRGNVIHDLHTAALMREHGVRVIYTRDNDFHRFRFLEVRDPVG